MSTFIDLEAFDRTSTVKFTSADKTVWSTETAQDILSRIEGAYLLGSGISRKVYAISDGLVLKIATDPHSWAGANREEWAAWTEMQCFEGKRFFAECFAHAEDWSWLVAERAEGIGYMLDYADSSDPWNVTKSDPDFKEVRRNLGIEDLHGGNIGWRADGIGIVVDYALNDKRNNCSEYGSVGYGSTDVESSQCHCSDCERDRSEERHLQESHDDTHCERCGICNCGTLEGCNATLCSFPVFWHRSAVGNRNSFYVWPKFNSHYHNLQRRNLRNTLVSWPNAVVRLSDVTIGNRHFSSIRLCQHHADMVNPPKLVQCFGQLNFADLARAKNMNLRNLFQSMLLNGEIRKTGFDRLLQNVRFTNGGEHYISRRYIWAIGSDLVEIPRKH